MEYILIIQNTTTKQIYIFFVADCEDTKLYFHFPDVDLSKLETGEHRYLLFEAPEEGARTVLLQNDPRRYTVTDNMYVLVADNKILTADDVVLTTTGEDYQTPLCCVATGLIKVGDYVQGGKQWDKPMEYKQYNK
jgi:hypothetical protein